MKWEVEREAESERREVVIKRKNNKMDEDSYYLSGYLDSLGSLPDDVKKTFAKMLELDTKNAEITKEIDAISEDYKRKVEEKRLHPRRRKAEMEKIAKMFDEAKINSDVKVKLAIDTYELVDKHINKLDADLVKFETEMREAGGRLSQTESEDEEILREKKEKKKKKKAMLREEERKKAEPVTPVTPCTEVSRDSGVFGISENNVPCWNTCFGCG